MEKKNNAACFLSAQFDGEYRMLAKGVHDLYITQGRTVDGSRRGGLQYTLADLTTCAFGVFCLSLLQDEKETEQLKSLERSFY